MSHGIRPPGGLGERSRVLGAPSVTKLGAVRYPASILLFQAFSLMEKKKKINPARSTSTTPCQSFPYRGSGTSIQSPRVNVQVVPLFKAEESPSATVGWRKMGEILEK